MLHPVRYSRLLPIQPTVLINRRRFAKFVLVICLVLLLWFPPTHFDSRFASRSSTFLRVSTTSRIGGIDSNQKQSSRFSSIIVWLETPSFEKRLDACLPLSRSTRGPRLHTRLLKTWWTKTPLRIIGWRVFGSLRLWSILHWYSVNPTFWVLDGYVL